MAEFGDMAYTRRLSSCSDTCMLIVVEASDIYKRWAITNKVSIKDEEEEEGGGVKGPIVVNDRLVCI